MADITKIASAYDMVEIMKNIGSNYFGEELSDQRIGMFGFTTEALANMFGAAILDASNRQKEYNISTARKRSTLLYEGAKFDVNIDNAKPGKMTAYIGILTSSITNPTYNGGYGTKEGDVNNPNYKLVLERDSVINIANFDFMFEHDIQINATYNQVTKGYTYSVQYLLEGEIDNTSLTGPYIEPAFTTAYDIDNKYIQSYVQTYNDNGSNISILLFKVELVQINRETTVYPIIKNDIISLTGLDFPYSNELSHFNVFYRKNNTSTWENIQTVPIYNSDIKYENNVIYYEVFHDEKKIRLDITDFKPAYNSEIRIDIYNTMGVEPNGLEYTGDGSDIIITLNTRDERHSYTGLELNCKPISSVSNGSSVPDIEELRKRVIRAKQTVNSVDTDYDLINYMKDRDSTNDCVFIKKRNDIIERRYSCYMIPRMLEKDIIPTSTLDFVFPNFKENSNTNIDMVTFDKAITYGDDIININDSVSGKSNIYYPTGSSTIYTKFTAIPNLYMMTISETQNDNNYIPIGSYKRNGVHFTMYEKLSKYKEDHIPDDNGFIDNNIIISDTYLLKFKENTTNKVYYFNNRKNNVFYDKISSVDMVKYFSPKNGIQIYQKVIDGVNCLKSYILETVGYSCPIINQLNNACVFIKDDNGEYIYEDGKYKISSDGTEKYTLYHIENNANPNIRFGNNDNNDITEEEFNTFSQIYNTIYPYKYACYKSSSNSFQNLTIYVKDTNDEYIDPYKDESDLYQFTPINNVIDYDNQYIIYRGDNSSLVNHMIEYKLSTNDVANLTSDLDKYVFSIIGKYIPIEYNEWKNDDTLNDNKYYLIRNYANGKQEIYYYPYYKSNENGKILLSNIATYVPVESNTFNTIIDDTYGYYIGKNNSIDLLYKELIYVINTEPQEYDSKYYYDNDQKCYILNVDPRDVKGIVYTLDTNNDRTHITIKAGTPFALKQNIVNKKYVEGEDIDVSFDLNKEYYKYPIMSLDSLDDDFKKENSLLVINRNETQEGNSEIPKFGVDENTGLYFTKNNEPLEKTMKVYSSPYTMVYDIENQIMSYYLTSISKTLNMNMIDEETDTPVNFSIDTITVERNTIKEEESVYTITLILITNGDISNAVYANNGITEKNTGNVANSIMLKGFIYDTDENLKGYINFDNVETNVNNNVNIFKFKGEFKISDILSNTYCTNLLNMHNIHNLRYDSMLENKYTDEILKEYIVPSDIKTDANFLNLRATNLRFAIGCYYIDRTGMPEEDINKYDSIETGVPHPIIPSDITGNAIAMKSIGTGTKEYPRFVSKCKYNESTEMYHEYILTNVYDNSMDLLDLFVDMSNYVKSAVTINRINADGDDIDILHFGEIPVIQYSQSLLDSMSKRITDIISNTHESLADLSNRITNNFNIDYKFFKTYGPCRYFMLESTNGSTKALDNLDITIEFSLLIKTNLNITDNDVVNQLKAYIKERIEELNSENEDYTIYISNIITDIENVYNDYVRSIELVSINGNSGDYRIIKYNKPEFNDIDYYSSITRTDIINYVPEYINVPLDNITINIRR